MLVSRLRYSVEFNPASSAVIEEKSSEFKELLQETGAHSKSNKDFQAELLKKKQELPVKQLSKVNINQLGGWEKHTKGFGMKMLQKMGFKGRLGKDEDGISAPVAVKVRPDKLGLGFGAFQEAGALKQNKLIENELHGTHVEQEEEIHEALIEPNDEKRWRKSDKNAAKRPKRVYKTVQDVVQKPEMKIIDMTKPKVATKVKFGQELMYNVKMLVEVSEMKVFDLKRKIQSKQEHRTSLSHEIDDVTRKRQRQAEELNQLQAIRGEIAILKAESTSCGQVIQALYRLKQQYPKQFQYELIPALVKPALERTIVHWDPLSGQHADLFQQLTTLKEILTSENPIETQGYKLFVSIMEDVVIDHIRSPILSQWDVQRPHSCVELIKFLEFLLPPDNMKTLLGQLIVPRLRIEVERCTRPETIHEWILPWQSLISCELKTMYPAIRQSIGQFLQNWNARDTTRAQEVVRPWLALWEAKAVSTFLDRWIIPKLVQGIRCDFNMTPGDENPDPLNWIAPWESILPPRVVIAIYVGEVFPKWINALQGLLTDSPDFTLLSEWYCRWKSRVPRVLIQDKLIRERLNLVLYLMNLAALDQPIPKYSIYPKSYKEAIRLHVQLPVAKGPAPEQNFDVRFQDVIEQAALEHNVLFLPDPRKAKQRGKTVYRFGKIYLVIDQGVIYAQHDASKEYLPISLEKLLQLAV